MTRELPLEDRGRVVELRDIGIFLTLAEELHFGRTADRLHVSQARVSQSIARQALARAARQTGPLTG